MNDQIPLLRLIDVVKRYEAVEETEVPLVLDGVSLDIEAGDGVAITGPSGSGKSTLLNIIGTLDRPTAGRVLLNGQDLADLDERALARLRNTQIGFVFQDHHLLPQCSVLENVLIPTLAGLSTESGEEVRARARRLIDRVGLGDRLFHRPGQLSGGERQRVTLVRALINQPALLLADEPTGSLDRDNAENLMDLLAALNREENVTLIAVTHAQELAARMGRLFELRNAQLIESAHQA